MGKVIDLRQEHYSMEKRVLDPDKSIVLASHIVVKGGCFPSRIVIRKENSQFITHMEILKGAPSPSDDTSGTGIAFVHHGFSNGKYFSFHEMSGRTEEEAWEQAVQSFKERVQKL